MLLGSDPEQKTVYGQGVGPGGREPNPDAGRSVERAADGHRTSMEDVPFDPSTLLRAGCVQDRGVDHRRPHALVAQQFLHGADVIPVLEQMRGERVAKGMATDRLVDPCQLDRSFDCPLQAAFTEVMAVPLASAGVYGGSLG